MIRMKKSEFFDKSKTSFCTADPMVYEMLKEYSSRMRTFPTDAEAIVWRYLRGSQLGKPFRRQHIIFDNIVDFVCLPSRLVVEIDGGYHDEVKQRLHDELRTEELEKMGFRVIRFTNEDVYNRIEYVLETIKRQI